MSSNVLVFGATGRVGSELVRQLLLQPNTRVTAAVRDVNKFDKQREVASSSSSSAVSAVQADLTAPDSLRLAVQHSAADRCFLYVTGDMKEAVTALKEAGIKHVVLLSSWTVRPDYIAAKDPVAMRHWPAEETIRASGLTWTFLRCGVFASNVFLLWKRGIVAGEVQHPHPDVTSSMVAHEDIAAVAVKALTSTELDNQVVPVVGPSPLSMHEVMAVVSRALGKPITVKGVSEAEWRQTMSAFLPLPVIDAILNSMRDQNRDKEGSPAAAERAMGRPPTTFDEYMERHKEELAVTK